MKKIRLLIANNYARFREELRASFAGLSGVEVVGETTEGPRAITQVDALQSDVVFTALLFNSWAAEERFT